jgi:16S rRNA (adenine1518-N6/adenine1519-N6)-dimethyltransferase
MHIKPKKRLGQHFLIDKNIQHKIINACNFNPSDIVLEIGAGRGELTRLIAGQVKYLYALEIDENLCRLLKDNLQNHANVKIISEDILKFNFKSFLKKAGNKIKIVGNIPYYIATPIIRQLLKYKEKIGDIFITVQKEFAQRMVALPGSKLYGSLSCFVQYYTQAKIIFLIKRTSFLPAPKVDSCLLGLEIRPEYPLNPKEERRFFKITRTAFNQRRKTLRNSLRGVISKQKLEAFFRQYSIGPNTRPEELSLKDFINLTNL